MKKLLLLIYFAVFLAGTADGQTASSLFRVSDSLQVSEIVTEAGDYYDKIGHHGPAVENSHMILRINFDDSGSIDVYSKRGRGMELLRYLWYPTDAEHELQGAGVHGYSVGETTGMGGFALWDGENVVRLVATKGRTARVGNTSKGSFAEMISYGVLYKGEPVDIMIRIDVTAKTRVAKITASELSGKKVRFLTGLNFHEGQKVVLGEKYASVWGKHPSQNIPLSLGAGIFFSGKDFPEVVRTDDMVRMISAPVSKVSTKVVAASTLEAELNNMKRFEAFMAK